MNLRRILGAVAVVGAVLTASIGCASQPDDAPIFASDEEALAAAEEALARYLIAAERVYSGETSIDELLETVSEERAQIERETFARYNEQGISTDGSQTVARDALIEWHVIAGDRVTVSMYACVDRSEFRVLDSDGVDVTPEDQSEQFATKFGFVGTADALLLDSFEPVADGEFAC